MCSTHSSGSNDTTTHSTACSAAAAAGGANSSGLALKRQRHKPVHADPRPLGGSQALLSRVRATLLFAASTDGWCGDGDDAATAAVLGHFSCLEEALDLIAALEQQQLRGLALDNDWKQQQQQQQQDVGYCWGTAAVGRSPQTDAGSSWEEHQPVEHHLHPGRYVPSAQRQQQQQPRHSSGGSSSRSYSPSGH